MKAVVFLFLFGLNLQAAVMPATSSESTSATTVKAPEKKDIDEEITNARLRAITGAKATVSFQSTFNYYGASIENPLGKSRPKLVAGAVGLDPVKIAGFISAKYRMTERDNLNLGIGLGWTTPTFEGQKAQLENPYLTYTRLFKLGDVQNVFTAAIQKYTANVAVNIEGLNYEAYMNHTVVTSVGKSKLQLGAVLSWTREFYLPSAKPTRLNALALYPLAEYNLSDKISLRTVYRGFTFANYADTPEAFQRDSATESAGFGISITRDIYLYPNIQWVWADMRPEKTNIALQANISM